MAAPISMLVGGHFDALHRFDMADVNHHRQFAVELGDLQGQVGAASEQTCLRVGGIQVGKVSDGQRQTGSACRHC